MRAHLARRASGWFVAGAASSCDRALAEPLARAPSRHLRWVSASCAALAPIHGGPPAGAHGGARVPRAERPSALTRPRAMSTDAAADVAFHRAADELLGNLQDHVEAWGEDASDLTDFDFSHESGVVTISLGDKGTYVINKQGPNRQIWMSSPVSGPLRYDYDGARKVWIYRRDGHALHERLRDELVSLGGGELNLEGMNER